MSRSCRRLQSQSSLLLGRIWLALGRTQNAKRAFQDVLKQRGEHFGAYVQLGRLALEEGNLPAAQKELSAAQRTDPVRFARLEERLTASLRPRDRRTLPDRRGLATGRRSGAKEQEDVQWADPGSQVRSIWFSGWFAETGELQHASGKARPWRDESREAAIDEGTGLDDEFLLDVLQGDEGLVGDDDDDDDLVEIEDLEADEFNWEEDSELISLDELPQISSPWGEMRGLDEEDSEASPETPLQNFYRELAREASPDEALASAEGDEPFWEASDEAHDDEEAAHVREHARFAELPPIVEEEIASVNWDELTFRLNHWDSD